MNRLAQFFPNYSYLSKEILSMHEIMKNDNLEENTDPHHFRSVDMIVYGHVFHIPSLMNGRRIALFTFHDLCEKPYGAADFIALSKIFHVVAIKDIPRLTLNQRNAVSTSINFNFYSPISNIYCFCFRCYRCEDSSP